MRSCVPSRESALRAAAARSAESTIPSDRLEEEEMRKLASMMLSAALAAAFCMDAAAQAYPNRPIRLINASAVGGPQEIIARVIAEGISPALGQPVIVESRPGGAGG